MIKEIEYFSLPTHYSPDREVLFMTQYNYKILDLAEFYTFPTKGDCANGFCVAIFTIKPKNP